MGLFPVVHGVRALSLEARLEETNTFARIQKLVQLNVLGLTDEQAKALFDAYWDAVEPLRNLRDAVGSSWEARGSS